MTLHLGTVKSMSLSRRWLRLGIEFTGGIPDHFIFFQSERALLEFYDELVAIDERERHDDA